MEKADLTVCRLALNRLVKEYAGLLVVFLDHCVLVKGSVYRMKTACGKAGCRCRTTGALHTAWRLSRSHRGQTQARCLAPADVRTYKRLTRSYRDFRKARARLIKIQREILALIDRMEAGRTMEPIIFRKAEQP